MEILHLSPRLQAVAELIPFGSRVADVGTDHGYLPVWLRQNGVSRYVIASDLNELPLASARDSAARCEADGIDFRLCDGLRGISPDEVDCVVIAGMSGETITAILAAADWDWTGKRLVLQPMTKRHELLAWLYERGFHAAAERFVRERRMYRIFCAEWGRQPLPRPAHLHGGFSDGPYARRKAQSLRKALNGLQQAAQPDTRRIGELNMILEDMQDAYHW